MGAKKGKKKKNVPDPGWWPGYWVPATMSTYFQYPTRELQDELRGIAARILVPRRGILGIEESTGTMGKRLQDIGVENTEENRRLFRQLVCTTDPAIGEFVSGITLQHETLYQKADDGLALVKHVKDRGIVPGIKVDRGVVPIFGSDQECTSQGLDDLAQRCAQYKKDDCHYTSWRVVFKISRFTPCYQSIMENANTLARFAAVCQSQRMLPIIEFELLPDGDHDLLRCQKITEMILAGIVKALSDHNVYYEGIILRPTMVTPGLTCKREYNPMDIARATVTALLRTVPVAVPGVMFTSGFQSAEESAVNLNAINTVEMKKPWRLSFNFGRAVTKSVFQRWAGRAENVVNAQMELLNRLRACGQASMGNYVTAMVAGTKNKEEPAKTGQPAQPAKK